MQRKNDKGIVRFVLIAISVAFLFVMLILPLLYVLYVAFREGVSHFMNSITTEYAIKSVLLTLKATVIAVVVNSIFGIFAALTITKYNFRGKKILSALIDLPLTISPVIAGLIYILTFGRQSILYPVIQKLKVDIIFGVPGIILATIFVTFPFISRELIPVLTHQGKDEEEAAALMGAGTFTIFKEITFPHIKWSYLYGVVLCSARALGEFGAVSVISGHLQGLTNTMTLYIELLYQGYDFTGAFAMSSVLVVIAILILIIKNVVRKEEN